MKNILLSASLLIVVSCTAEPTNPQSQFMDSLSALCGQSFAGKLVSTDEADKDFAAQNMVMHVGPCTETEIHIPFYAGDDRSRTWMISKTKTGLRLKHRHNHEDGSADILTHYGGDTSSPGTANRQEFPVDQFSKDLFTREGLDVSTTNIWAIEITPKIYVYELRREGRHFRVEFDLNAPIPTPLPPW